MTQQRPIWLPDDYGMTQQRPIWLPDNYGMTQKRVGRICYACMLGRTGRSARLRGALIHTY